MANNLTGDFEAVVQISVRRINGILASLHQNGAHDDAVLKLLHSVGLRVGDRPMRPGGLGDFGDWVHDLVLLERTVGVDHVRGELAGLAPPGTAKRIEREFAEFGQVGELPPATVRGTVRAQLAAPTLSIPSGSASEVSIHVGTRAHYYADANTTDLPKPVHGEVQVTFDIQRSANRLVIRPSPDDNKIQFISAPGAGLSAADSDQITTQIRKAVRENVSVLPMDLPAGFPFSAFKGLGSGSGEALALPLNLTNANLPVGNIQSVNNLFIGSSSFAVAVSKDFVKGAFAPAVNSLLQFKQDFSVPIPVLPDPTYHFSVTGVDLEFTNGSINLIVKGKATTGYPLAPNYNNIVVKQRFTLGLLGNFLFIMAVDADLTVSGLPGAAINAVKHAVAAARNQAIWPAQTALNQQLSDARNRLTTALHSFDPAAEVDFRIGTSEDANASTTGAIAVTPDGVIIRGSMKGSGRLGPIVHVEETEQRHAFTALKCWIPGGRIDRMIWSWVEHSGPAASIFSGILKTATVEHDFVFPKPAGVTEVSRVCLRIEGTQTLADGSTVSVAGGTTCHLPDYGKIMEVPSWWEPVTVPVWFPDSSENAVVKEFIAAHVSVQSSTPRKSELTHNTLVYFADWQAENPLEALIRGLEHMRTKKYSLVVIVVVPEGAFDRSRREIEAKLDSFAKRFSAQLWLTEDNQRGWTQSFASAKLPAAFLINAWGKFVWKYEGNTGAGVLANALDKDLVPAPAPRFQALRLAVSVGERAPEVSFTDDQGQGAALHRMRGRPVLFNFWQSWSAPCVKELRRLQQLYAQSKDGGPIIVAFHGGKDAKDLEEIRKQYGLTLPIVQDTEQRIGRTYGVRCWPTTVSINAVGLVDHIQLGFLPAPVDSPGPKEEKAV